VKVAATTAGSPKVCTRLLKEAGVMVMHVVATVDHALKAEAAGVDAVVASGMEAGGFLSHDELTTLVLVPQVVDAVKLPVIAAGGIGDARGFVASLALGADGIQMGTRFITTRECTVGTDYKQAILKAIANSTEVIDRGKAPARNLRADFLNEMSLDPSTSYGAGQVVGLIENIPTVAELFGAMIHMASLANNQVREALSELS
jgi:enoyl-[acyl-carrier protein] reductase II